MLEKLFPSFKFFLFLICTKYSSKPLFRVVYNSIEIANLQNALLTLSFYLIYKNHRFSYKLNCFIH